MPVCKDGLAAVPLEEGSSPGGDGIPITDSCQVSSGGAFDSISSSDKIASRPQKSDQLTEKVSLFVCTLIHQLAPHLF